MTRQTTGRTIHHLFGHSEGREDSGQLIAVRRLSIEIVVLFVCYFPMLSPHGERLAAGCVSFDVFPIVTRSVTECKSSWKIAKSSDRLMTQLGTS